MLQSFALPAGSPYLQSAIKDLQHEIGYWVAVALCLVGSVLILGGGIFWTSLYGVILGILLIATALAAYPLMGRAHLAGAWLFVAGATVANLVTLQWYPFGSVAALLALPTGLATLLISTAGGLATAVLASLITMGGIGAFSSPQDGSQIAALAAVWGVMALTWASTEHARQSIKWSWDHYERARQLLEEAQDQRLELKQTQEDLTQANGQLARLFDRLKAMYQVAEEARRAKEEFVARVSHELRTPLNMIIGFSDLIARTPYVYEAKLPPALMADIAAIQRNSQHLSSLIEDVLALSQAEAGRMALSKEWTSVEKIIDEAVEAVRVLFASKGLSLEIDVPSDLPSVFCDSTRIRQVVLNLLSNAGRFTERGGVRVKVHRDSENVVVSVVDTGPGIASEYQKKVFEPFEQLESSLRRHHGGSGLGLTISKQFVEMHGGNMRLESEVGVGTTVYFSLPLDTSSPTGDSPARWFSPYHSYDVRKERSKAPMSRVVPRFVLLESGGTLSRLFSRHMDDAEIVSVQTSEAATQELSRSPAQALVVNDSTLRHMPTSMEDLSNVPYGTPVVTCWIPEDEETAQQLGIARYLVKPITRESLLSALGDLGKVIKTILLVDDDPEALQLFSRMLSSAKRGYRVSWAKSGREALNLLRKQRPDVVLLDLIVPDMDGFEVLQKKSQDPALCDIPTIVMSAKDPMNQPIVSSVMTITRGGGLSAVDLLTCIQAVSRAFYGSVRSADQESSGTPPA